MTTTGPTRSWRLAPLWMKALFTLSLLLNFTAIGVAAGAAYKSKEWRGRFGGGHTIAQMVRALPGEDRRALLADFDANKARLREARKTRRDARRALSAAVIATPYSPDAVREALEMLRVSEADMKAEVYAMMAKRLDAMSDEARAEMEEALKKGRRGRHRETSKD